MKKLRFKKWVKVTIIIATIAIVGFILANYEEYEKKCSVEKGYSCSYYEIRDYMIRGN